MNVARLLYLGTSQLGFSEAEVFRMTPRKFYLLFEEHLDYHGKKKSTEYAIDEMWDRV